jgi:hypothetical protein
LPIARPDRVKKITEAKLLKQKHTLTPTSQKHPFYEGLTGELRLQNGYTFHTHTSRTKTRRRRDGLPNQNNATLEMVA